MNSNTVKLGEFFLKKGKTVNPLKHQSETFELYSIPAYDKQKAEILTGVEIGSSKKLLYPNDVILSRIVPHIRRCWIVPSSTGHRQIGSGEWIIFKSDDVYPPYLRYYLLSDTFNKKFMSTVKGVGGSLLRADPKQVAKFNIPLPPLPTQKKIAAILDAADELRRKDKALIVKYDELTQSLFLDMFGDPLVNPKDWEKEEGAYHYEVRGRVGWKGYKKTDLRESGPLVIGATHVNALGEVDLQKAVYLSEEKYFESPEIMVQMDDLLFVQRGNTIGKIAIVNNELGPATINPVLLIFRPINSNPLFLLYLLMNERIKQNVVDLNSGSAQPMITQKSMKEYILINPPTYLQNQFADFVKVIAFQRLLAKESLRKSESLFNSLLQKAFKGELTN